MKIMKIFNYDILTKDNTKIHKEITKVEIHNAIFFLTLKE
jgi:hypothetical protein